MQASTCAFTRFFLRCGFTRSSMETGFGVAGSGRASECASIQIDGASQCVHNRATHLRTSNDFNCNSFRYTTSRRWQKLHSISKRAKASSAVCGEGKSMPQKSFRGSRITKAYRKPSGSRSNSASTRARAVLESFPFWRRSVSSCPGSTLSDSRKTPPFRLTSSVCAVCFMTTPPDANQDASIGIRKLTRSLWRSPSGRMSSFTRKKLHSEPSMSLRAPKAADACFVVPTNNPLRGLFLCCLFRNAPRQNDSGTTTFSAHLGVRDTLPHATVTSSTADNCEQYHFYGRAHRQGPLA